MRRIAVATAVSIVVAALAACSTLVASGITRPPPYWPRPAERERLLETAGSKTEFFRRAEGPRIAYAVIEPGDHALHYEFRSSFGRWTWRLTYADAVPRMPARGTLVLLHGWSLDGTSNLAWALAFAERGWRAVLVDLRSHGRSGRAPAGFGTREADDVRALIGQLRRDGRIAEPLALFGVSLGAVTALHVGAAAGGVAAVIALEPFANAADSVRTGLVGLTNDSAEALFAGDVLETGIARASRKLQLDLATLDTAPVLARVPVCSVLVHGQRDTVVPVDASRALEGVNPRAQRLELPHDGHFSTAGRVDLLADPLAAWLDGAVRADGDCPPLRVYALESTDGVRRVLPSPWRRKPAW